MTFTTRTAILRAVMLGATALTMTAGIVTPAAAQNVTSSISGQVLDDKGAGVPGAVIKARNDGTNQVTTTTSGVNGQYSLAGLSPAPYTITTDVGGATVTQHVTVQIGQSATLDLAPTAAVAEGAPAVGTPGEIVVTGRRLVETRTSEVATNVSQEQIKRLPQGDRNFLSFTQLAPGV